MRFIMSRSMLPAFCLTAGLVAPAGAQESVGLKSVWKADLPAGVRRIAVADMAGDGKPRLLALGAGSTLTVFGIGGDAPAQEATVDLGPSAEEFVAGRFAKDKGIIAAPGVVVVREGDSYKPHKTSKVDHVTGVVRFADGTENAFRLPDNGPPESWAVDLAAKDPVVDGHEMPDPGQNPGAYSYALIH